VASIFVAYRESDARGWAFALRDLLVQAYGSDAVFLDKDSLRAGAWSVQLEQAIEGCKVMLVVIGNGWLHARDDSGARRLDANDDVHRRELEYALALPQVTVLPLLVDRAQPLRADDLPPSLARLEAQQGLPWGDSARHRQADSERLFDEIDRLTGLQARRPRSARRARLLPLGVSLLLTAAAATGFASTMQHLNSTELAVLFSATTALAYGVGAVWRRLGIGV
jgi:hypothetical protein